MKELRFGKSNSLEGGEEDEIFLLIQMSAINNEVSWFSLIQFSNNGNNKP